MRTRDGFTLIELMIVVVIIGILAAIAVPKFSGASRSAKESEARPILKQLYTLQERYKQKVGTYATDVTELEGGTANYDGKYYTFVLAPSSTADAYVACGTPRDPSLGLRSFQVDEAGNVSEGGC